MNPAVATWVSFNVVAVAGFVVQAAALEILLHVGGFDYLAASALAVEIAVLHNFVWHTHWTWRGRTADPAAGWIPLLLRYHVTQGLFSLVGTVFFMRLLVEGAGLRPVLANLFSTALCGLLSVAKFFALDRYVFKQRLGRHGVSGF